MARPLPKKTSYQSKVRQYLTGMAMNNSSNTNPRSQDRSRASDSRQYRDTTGAQFNGGGGFTLKQNIFFG